jgi:hypothetical protein
VRKTGLGSALGWRLTPILGLPSVVGAWISQHLLALALFLIWRKRSGSLAQEQYARRAATYWFLLISAILWLGISPFLLWTLRIIPVYGIALFLALMITGLLVWWGLHHIVPLMRAARGATAQDSEPSADIAKE